VRFIATLLGVLLLAPAAQAGPTVSVRVEGQSATLLERTTVTLGDGTDPSTGCPAASAAAAIEAGTRGNWDRQRFTQTILGERHAFENADYWAEWIGRGGGYVFGGGICDDILRDGDELVMLVDRSPAGQSTVFPLAVEGLPSAVHPFETVTVVVVEYRNPMGVVGGGTRTPVAGAQVAGGGASATTDADGRATLRFTADAEFTVKATRPGNAPSAGLPVAVRATGGTCSDCGPIVDRTRPLSRLTGIANGQRFRAGRGPRTLSGTVTDVSRLHAVKLRLTRRDRGRCWTFSGRSERFRRVRCGRGSWFRIGSEPRFSYLLPARPPRGRYVLDVKAIDAAFNREEQLDTGRNRVVFRVR
jgi:hypothetical protein